MLPARARCSGTSCRSCRLPSSEIEAKSRGVPAGSAISRRRMKAKAAIARMTVDANAAMAVAGVDNTVTRVTGTEFSVLPTGVVALSGLKYAGGAAGVSRFEGVVLGRTPDGGAIGAISAGVGSGRLMIFGITGALEVSGPCAGAGGRCGSGADAGALLDGFSLGDGSRTSGGDAGSARATLGGGIAAGADAGGGAGPKRCGVPPGDGVAATKIASIPNMGAKPAGISTDAGGASALRSAQYRPSLPKRQRSPYSGTPAQGSSGAIFQCCGTRTCKRPFSNHARLACALATTEAQDTRAPPQSRSNR
jgi:hypothetical protein